MDTTPSLPANPTVRQRVHHHLFHVHVPQPLFIFALTFLITSAVGLIAVSLIINSHHSALSNTICVVNAANRPRVEVSRTVDQQIDNIKLNITVGGETITATPENLGLEIDADATVSNIVTLDEQSNLFAKINPFPTCDLGLVATYDPNHITAYLESVFPDLITSYREVSIQFQDDQFTVDPGQSGTRFNLEPITAAIDSLLAHPRTASVTADLIETPPQIPLATANQVTAQLNQTLDQPYIVKYNNQAYYTISRADLASAITVAPDTDAKQFAISYNRDTLVNLVNAHVVKPLSSSVRNQVEYTYPNGSKFIATKGANGRGVTNAPDLVDQLFTGLQQHQSTTVTANVNVTNFQTNVTTVDADRWIDINLKTRTVTLFNGQDVYTSFRVGIGKSSTPTVTGNFVIYRKVAGPKCMSGGEKGTSSYYNLCNIHWTSYFHGAYAFHEAWWTNAHNQPAVSHGCINMTKDDAKTLYDFAPVGTPVYSHY
jgi:lipoprotein-anchoring transpeptidase ErfK/SrfK